MSIFKFKKFLKKDWIKVSVFFIVFLVTFILRAHNYDKSPTAGNLEEMLYAWSGIYLVETGVPVSWSTLPYPDRTKIFGGEKSYKGDKPTAGVNLYSPWLDEPPLFSYLIGWFEHYFEDDRNDMIPTAHSRFIVILASTLTALMVFIVARNVGNFWMGILAMFLYGTIPIIVLGSRLAVPENLIALLFMVVVYLLIKFNLNPRFIYLLPIPILAGLAGLAKPTGYFIMPIAIYYVMISRKFKYIWYLILGIIPFILAYIAYGYYYDAELFWQITTVQGSRPLGFGSLAWFFISPAYDWRMFTESWYIFCLLSAAYFIFNPPEGVKKIIVLSIVYWLAVVMLSGGEGDLLAWYRFPIFPLLAIVGSWGIVMLVQKANVLTTFLAAGMLLGNRHLLVNAFHPNVSPFFYRTVFSSLMIPSILESVFQTKYLKLLNRLIIIGILIAGTFINVKYIYNEYEIVCQNVECLEGPSTWVSELYFPIIWRIIAFKS